MAAPPSSPTIKYLTIKAGDTGIIPTNVKILSVVATGNAQAEADCIDLPEPEAMACFSIKWVVEVDSGGGTGPWSLGDPNAKLHSIVISETEYLPTDMAIDGGATGTPTPSDLENFVTANIPPSVMTPISLTYGGVGERRELVYAFQAPESIGSTIYIDFVAPGLSSDVGARVYAEACADCCDVET